MTAKAAAAYLGVSWTTFNNWVNMALLPAALPVMKRWDRKAIDAAIDRMSGLEAMEDHGYEIRKRERDARKADSFHSTDAKAALAAAYAATAKLRKPYASAKGDYGPNRNWQSKDWEDHVRDRPLGKREISALGELIAQKPNAIRIFKGAGPSTMDRLVARGFAKAVARAEDPTRMPDYSITAAGEAAWLRWQASQTAHP